MESPDFRHEFCTGCGRLMADEPGELCEHCMGQLPVPRASGFDRVSLHYAPVTWLLIVSCTFWVLCTYSPHGDFAPWGAQVGMEVAAGSWWQLVTAIFPHAGMAHLLSNMFFLWLLGKLVEKICGSLLFAGFFFAAGVAGNVVSFMVHPEVTSLGSSGAICGLVGILLVYYSIRIKRISGNQRFKLLLLAVLAVLCVIPGQKIGRDNVDAAVHAGGLVAGMLLAPILLAEPAKRLRIALPAFAGVAVVLLAAMAASAHRTHYLLHAFEARRALAGHDFEHALSELDAAEREHAGSPGVEFLRVRLNLVEIGNGACAVDRNAYDVCKRLGCKHYVTDSVDFPKTDGGVRVFFTGSQTTSIPYRTEAGWREDVESRMFFVPVTPYNDVLCFGQMSDKRAYEAGHTTDGERKPIKWESSYGTLSETDPAFRPILDEIKSRRGW